MVLQALTSREASQAQAGGVGSQQSKGHEGHEGRWTARGESLATRFVVDIRIRNRRKIQEQNSLKQIASNCTSFSFAG